MTKTAVILGAGVSGLYAATKFLEKGIDVHIIEKDDHAGGLSSTIIKEGCPMEYGPHTFHTVFNDMLDEFKHYVGKDFVMNRLDRQLSFGGKFYKYPPTFVDILKQTSPLVILKCFFSFSYSLMKRKLKLGSEKNAEEWLINNYGKELYKIYFKDYTEKVWGIPPNKLSTIFVSQRIPKISIRQILLEQFKKGIINMRKGDHIYAPHVSHIYYSKQGSGKLPNELLKSILKKGAKIYYNSDITSISSSKNKARSINFVSDNNKITLKFDYMVSTVPLFDLLQYISPSAPDKVIRASKQLHYRKIDVVAFHLKKDRVINPQWVYYRDRSFNRLSEPKNYGLHMPKGTTVIYLELSGNQASTKEAITKKLIEELESEGLVKKEEIINSFFLSTEFGYPIYNIGFEKRLAVIKQYLGNYNNLYSIGRQGLFKYIDMDICMKMAQLTVNHMCSNDAKKDVYITTNEVAFF